MSDNLQPVSIDIGAGVQDVGPLAQAMEFERYYEAETENISGTLHLPELDELERLLDLKNRSAARQYAAGPVSLEKCIELLAASVRRLAEK